MSGNLTPPPTEMVQPTSAPDMVQSIAGNLSALLPTVLQAVAAAPDATIAPDHESRIAKMEAAFAQWGPLLETVAQIASKVG